MRASPFTRSPALGDTPSTAPGSRRPVGRSRVPLHRRLVMARAAFTYWLAVLLLSLFTAAVTFQLVHRAATAQRRFGPVRTTLVASGPLRAGQRLTTRNTRRESRPIAQLPAGALSDIPIGAAVAGPVARGEVLTRTRLGQHHREQLDGSAAIAVPLGDTPLALRAGQHVDVYATYDPSLVPAATNATGRVAVRAVVVRAARRSATLIVDDAEVAGLVAAVARATLTVVLVG